MFIGHLGARLALKKIDRRVNLGLLFATVLFLDILLWVFVVLGLEYVRIPPDFEALRYAYYFFPYSHSLASVLLWSTGGYIAGCFAFREHRHRAGIVIAAGIFSHFVLDVIVHPAQIPLWNEASPKVGFGLWNTLAVSLLIEFFLLGVGLFYYYSSTIGERFAGKYGIIILFLVLTPAAFLGQLFGPKPENGMQMAISSLATIIIVILLASWLDRKRSTHSHHITVDA